MSFSNLGLTVGLAGVVHETGQVAHLAGVDEPARVEGHEVPRQIL